LFPIIEKSFCFIIDPIDQNEENYIKFMKENDIKDYYKIDFDNHNTRIGT